MSRPGPTWRNFTSQWLGSESHGAGQLGLQALHQHLAPHEVGPQHVDLAAQVRGLQQRVRYLEALDVVASAHRDRLQDRKPRSIRLLASLVDIPQQVNGSILGNPQHDLVAQDNNLNVPAVG